MSSKYLQRGLTLAQKLLAQSFYDVVSGCQLWAAGCYESGYGSVSHDGHSQCAHVAAWICVHGPVPKGRWVLHTCDVRKCINVDHLYLGDAQDNANDRMNRGRHRSALGERNGLSKLTVDQVHAIRADPRPHRTIATDYAVSHNTIGCVKRGVVWGHVQQESAQ